MKMDRMDNRYVLLVKPAFCRTDLFEEVVRQLDKDTRAIASNWVAAATAAVVEVDADFQCALDDVVRLAAFHVDDEADTAIFVFVLGVVEALCFRLHMSLVHN